MSEFEKFIVSVIMGIMSGIILIGLWTLIFDIIPLKIYMWKHRKDKSTHPMFYQEEWHKTLAPKFLTNIYKNNREQEQINKNIDERFEKD